MKTRLHDIKRFEISFFLVAILNIAIFIVDLICHQTCVAEFACQARRKILLIHILSEYFLL